MPSTFHSRHAIRPAVCVRVLICYLASSGSCGPHASAETPTTPSVYSEAFQKNLAEQGHSEQQLASASSLLKANQAEPSAEIATTIYEQLNADFAAAIRHFQAGNSSIASEKLLPLAESDDKFLRSEAHYFLAKCYAESGDFEQALPQLDAVVSALPTGIADVAPRASEFLFLRGICQANMLKREEAIDTLANFMRRYPNASERQRITAWRQLEILSSIEEGTLVDAYQKMEFARRRLAFARTNEPTQSKQQATISILDKLIKEAEEREAVSESESKKESKGKGKSEGQGKGKQGMGKGADDKTPMQTVRQIQQGTTATPWDHLRDKQRDAKALAAIKEKYPARYRTLIEQYYRSLQEESDQK